MNTPTRPRKRAAKIQTVDVRPEYLEHLAERARAIGLLEVARAAGLSRTSLWAAVTDRKPGKSSQGQRASYGVVMRIRAAILELDPDGSRIPEPFIRVGGPGSPTWRAALRDHD